MNMFQKCITFFEHHTCSIKHHWHEKKEKFDATCFSNVPNLLVRRTDISSGWCGKSWINCFGDWVHPTSCPPNKFTVIYPSQTNEWGMVTKWTLKFDKIEPQNLDRFNRKVKSGSLCNEHNNNRLHLIMSLGTWQNPFGPGALNNLIFFEIPESATLSCGSSGSRCSFTREDFGQIDDDGGAIADQLEGAVWTTSKCIPSGTLLESFVWFSNEMISSFVAANLFETDVVNLRFCEYDVCLAACFSDCICKLPDGSECTQTTPPPTPPPSPVNEPSPIPPEAKVCAMKKNTDLCATVAVDRNLRAGEVCDYCYNFCNGKFLGCCDENGQCSQTPCTADEETGELEEVFGCPEIFIALDPSTPTDPSNPDDGTKASGTSGASTLGLSSTLAATAGLVMFLAREFN